MRTDSADGWAAITFLGTVGLVLMTELALATAAVRHRDDAGDGPGRTTGTRL